MARQFPAALRTAAWGLATCTALISSAAAQTPRAMLVVDGSNSMWGQIDGTAKITIAREVVQDLLADLPPDLALGLTAYGHRRSGDCTDVEVLVPPDANSRSAIRSQMEQLIPRGKTPMAEAVRQAAESLGAASGPATVILVSDGVETCAPDVCEAVRALNNSSVDFTAHVIGFDIRDKAAHDQFACVAQSTGGRYLSVDSADELSAALIATTALPERREALPLITQAGRVHFVASHKVRGKLQNLPAHWQLHDGSGALLMTGFHNSGGQIDLKPGSYQLTAIDPDSKRSETRKIRITHGGSMQITLMFP